MLWLLLIATLLGLACVYAFFWKKIARSKPVNYPSSENRKKLDTTKKTLVCLGDSITQGNLSYNWVDVLAEALPDMQVLNAGINSDLTFSILNRIEDVIASQPDYLIVLVGTNDVNATMGLANLNSYKQSGRISKDTIPDFGSFKNNYRAIVKLLKQKTRAQIALVSLPVMSEDLAHEANRKADDYSLFVKELAIEQGIGYVPFREKQKEYLVANPHEGIYTFEDTTRLFMLSLINHYILGKDWDSISAKHGNLLTPDNLHLNSVSGSILLDLAKAFIISAR
ncbi:SGNH/GDSL hydrolase family protein [Emticicia sp. TH156]|uniref:SGNH/GDSL hydrolase family protein n=1 Tax=Emticicia sp. TH156 TaxID=2067454 RepID=UPI000C774984|nr:SGNH/GDSL hydrolase family protein [Emticicia sp. TH156]PLK46387.1 hypothetical protein C0V77_03315 [Emticicia sp. TH156]